MSIYDIDVQSLDGATHQLNEWRGRVLLIVNVASQCGFTPQYKGLESLYRKHIDQGLTVMGFPCNQFGQQEPGNSEEIRDFCSATYDVTFPMFARIEVNGANTHRLYQQLKSAQRGLLGTEAIKWNFTKFLVDRRGKVVARYAPNDTPEKIEKDILPLLAEPAPT
jgi:glutathione peroxidase